MADEPHDKPPRHPDGPPVGSPPTVPINREELLRQEAELAASMQSKLDQACQRAPPATPGGNKLGARKDASFKAICTAPSINWTPAGSGQVPVPYQTVQDLSNSVSTARTVRFNGLPACLLDQTTQPKGTGDERGTGKGVRSGTVTGEVKPVSGCKTVRIEGKQVVREGDKCTMNGGNNPGIFIWDTAKGLDVSQNPTTVSDRSLSDILGEMARHDGVTQAQQSQWDEKYSFSRPIHTYFKVGPQLRAWNPAEEQQRLLKTRNSISMALLGPQGVLGALARLTGASEQVVSEANDLGAAVMAATSTAMIGPRLSQARQSRTTIPRTSPSVTGVKIKAARSLPANKLGTEKGNFSYANPGPLPEDMAATFSGSKYTEFVLTHDTVLYRAGIKGQPLGQYFSIEAPGGIIQTRIDKAVLPRWPGGGESPIDTSFGVVIPAGTKVYVGKVATQGGFYSGGTEQVVVQRPWTIPGVKVISQEPIK